MFSQTVKMYDNAVRIHSKGYLPILLLPPLRLYGMSSEVKKALQKMNSDYDLVLLHLFLYYDM